MKIELKVYDNGDHTCLVWLPNDHQPIKNCRGFTIKKISNGKPPVYLHGLAGFSDRDTLDPNNPWKFPLQRYIWWDYLVDLGDVVQYSIVPVVGPDQNHLSLAEDLASPFTQNMTITGQGTGHIAAYFNKGLVAAQWVSQAMAKEPKGSTIQKLVATPGDPMRDALSGLLRPQILDLLADAEKAGGKIYAALYELNDPELIKALVAFGKNCNLILGNGAFKPPDNDENKAVRAQLKPKINVYDRIVTSGHFAHNKVVVVCDSAGKPLRVLTGSTNWTSSGLCTQANNGLIIDDPAVAQDYLDAWNRIHTAGNAFPPNLIAANSTAKTFQVDGCSVTPWHVPTSHAQDLDYARKLINAAQDGILFLFFNPGTFQPDNTPEKWTLLQNVLNRHHEENNAYYNPNLYIKGVVNQDIPYLTTDTPPQKGKKPSAQPMDPTTAAHPVALYSSGIEPPDRLPHDVLVPANIKQQFANWEMVLGAHLNVASNVMVLDPFGQTPVVMTGSHNLGFKASSKNDDNLIVIEGNGPLAAAYAINIIAIFQSYRWNSYVTQHRNDPTVWQGLVDNDTWQASYMTGDDLAEIEFWLGGEPIRDKGHGLFMRASESLRASSLAQGIKTSHTSSIRRKRPARTLKAFLSSTSEDLAEYRAVAVAALERLGLQVLRMDVFGARPLGATEASFEEIEAAEVFIGIYAHRYGFIPPGSEVSITEQEFDHAQKKNKPIFCLLLDENYPWLPRYIDAEPSSAKLAAFKHKVSLAVVRDTFTTSEDLAYKVASSIGRFLITKAVKEGLEQVSTRDFASTVAGRDQAARRAARLQPILKGAHVLLVNDVPSQMREVVTMLQRIGMEVEVVSSSSEALSALTDRSFDVVISDMARDQVLDEGIRLLNAIRARRIDTRLIFTVGQYEPEKGTPAFAFGITNQVDELLNLICDALERVRG